MPFSIGLQQQLLGWIPDVTHLILFCHFYLLLDKWLYITGLGHIYSSLTPPFQLREIFKNEPFYFRCTRACLDDEAELSSLPVDETDPDLVLANRVAITKELKVLSQSKNRYIKALSCHLIDGAPSKGQVLPKNMGRKRPSDLYRELRYKK